MRREKADDRALGWLHCRGGRPVSASKEYFGDGHQSFRTLAFRRDLAEFLVAAHPKVWRLRDIHVATKLNVLSWAGPRPTRHYVGDQMTRVGPPVVSKGSLTEQEHAPIAGIQCVAAASFAEPIGRSWETPPALRHCSCVSAN